MDAKLLRRAMTLPIVMALYVSCLHIARVPDGTLLPAFSARTVAWVAIAWAGLAGFAGVTAAVAWIGREKPGPMMARVLDPLYLLAFYPLSILVFHPLGVPLPFSTLLHPRVVLALAGSLAAFRLAMLASIPLAPRASGLFRWIASRSDRQLATLLFFIFLALYGLLIRQDNRAPVLVGDEPHYMLMMESLRTYGTADLTRILASDDPLPHGVRKIQPHTSGQSRPGTRYEVHHVGTALMMIPGFSLFGYKGAIGTFALLSALLVSNMFLLTATITGRRGSAWILAAIAGCAVPFFFYFRFIYPEVPAALGLLFAVRLLWRDRPSPAALLLAGVSAALMPWFHVKFVLLSATLAAFCVWKHRRSLASIAAYLIPHVPSAVLMMLFFHRAYGSWLPNAQYGGAYATVSTFFFRGAPGLLLDRDHGLLAFAPMFWLAVPGLWRLYRTNRAYVGLSLALAIPSFVIVSSHWMWWGGPCPAARFLVPFIPLFVPAVAAALACTSRPAFRLLAAASIFSTLALSHASLTHLRSLPFHVHYFRWMVMDYDAFPFLPLFFIHRSVEVPAGHFVTAGLWAAVFLGTLFMVRPTLNGDPFAQTVSRASWSSVMTAGALFLLVPGAIGYAGARLSGEPTDHPAGSTRSPAHVNLLLDAYARPFSRARVPIGAFADRVGAYTIHADVPLHAERTYGREDLDDASRGRHWIFFGNYTRLYPVGYAFRLRGDITTEASGDLARIEVCSDGGRRILTEYILPSDALHDSRFEIRIPLRPDRIENRAEIRADALAPGRFVFHELIMDVHLP